MGSPHKSLYNRIVGTQTRIGNPHHHRFVADTDLMHRDVLKSIQKAENHLKTMDPQLGSLIDELGPHDWQVYHQPPFYALLRAIIGQQLSVKAANAIETRVLALLPPALNEWPSALINATVDELRAAGLSQSKVRTVQTLATQVHQDSNAFEALCQQPNAVVRDELCAIPGIGPWTVDMFLMFGLNRLDVFSGQDLGLRKALAIHMAMENRPTAAECNAIAERWKPYRTVAAWHLWRLVD